MEIHKWDSRFETIDLDQVDFKDRRFAVAYPPEADEALVSSVRSLGLFVPVVLFERPGGLFRVVSGSRRLPAARDAGLKKIPAQIIKTAPESEPELFILNVSENAATRKLNHMEKGLILQRLITDFRVAKEDVLPLLPLIGLTPGKRVLEQYLRLPNLTKPLRRYVVSHSIPIRVSARVAEWASEDQEALSGILQEVQMGGNALRESLDLVEEIALRDRIKIREVLSGNEVRQVMEAPKVTATQKRTRLKQSLFAIRYPTVTDRTEKISGLLKRGALLRGVRLSAPAYLEGNTLEACFSFGSIKELKEKAGGLCSLASREEVRSVLRLLNPEEEL